MSEGDLVKARRATLAELRAHGIDPFATLRYEVSAHAHALLDEVGQALGQHFVMQGILRPGGKVITIFPFFKPGAQQAAPEMGIQAARMDDLQDVP